MQQNNSTSSYFILTILFLLSSTSVICAVKMSDQNSPSTAVYIVYTDQPSDDVEPESFHLSTLSSLLGSENAAKDSLVYVYKNAATGFSAKLTPEQVSELQKQPGVIQVVESKQLKLHGNGGGARTMRM